MAFKDIPTQSASCHLADCLVHMFNQNKQVNTIKVHPSSITSALRLLNPPNQLQDDTITDLPRAMAIQRPRITQVLPIWCPSVVLKAFFKPFFMNNRSDKIPLDLLTFKTAFLVSLESAAQGSELVALPRADHNITFSSDCSRARHVSIKMVPKFMPKNARLNTIPNSVSFMGISHLFSSKPERLLCPVRVLGLYITDRYFKSWFIIIINKKGVTIAMMTGLRLCGWSPGLIWTDEIPPLYLDAVSLGFHW